IDPRGLSLELVFLLTGNGVAGRKPRHVAVSAAEGHLVFVSLVQNFLEEQIDFAVRGIRIQIDAGRMDFGMRESDGASEGGCRSLRHGANAGIHMQRLNSASHDPKIAGHRSSASHERLYEMEQAATSLFDFSSEPLQVREGTLRGAERPQIDNAAQRRMRR